MRNTLLAACITLAFVAGCSHSSSGGDHDGHSSSGSSTSSGDTGDAGDGGSTSSSLKAPTINAIMKMSGALHVTWTNNDATCEFVEGERQAQMADGSVMEKYKVVFTVPGTVDNKHDTTATADMKYTYRLRCKKGTDYSGYSNEMSANPVK